MFDAKLRSAFPLRRESGAFAHAARWASIDRNRQRASGRACFGIPISTRHASIPAAPWSPHACRVVSRANIKPTDAGRCRAMQPSRESRSNSMSLRMIYRGAEAQSRCYRIRSIATNGRLARHPQSTPPTGPTASPDAQPALKKWALSVFLRVRRRQCTLRLVKEHPPRKHERAGISCVKVKSRGAK